MVEEHGLTGFEGFDPVEVARVIVKRRQRFRGRIPGCYHVTVVRSEAAVDQVRSGVEWEEGAVVCPVCRQANNLRRWQRVILEEGTWTGEDIFHARPLSACITSERFKDVCETYRIANAVLIPAEEYGHDFYPWERG